MRSLPGGRKLAHFADVELKRLMGTAPAPADQPSAAVAPSSVPAVAAPSLDGTGQSTDTAAIDRQITAMLPSLPEPPGVPALPVKPAAGPVIPLSRMEVSPGGSLLSGRPRDADNLGTVERTLLHPLLPLLPLHPLLPPRLTAPSPARSETQGRSTPPSASERSRRDSPNEKRRGKTS